MVNATTLATGWLALRRGTRVAAQDDRDADSSLQDDGADFDDLPLCAGCGVEERCVAGRCCPRQQDCFDVCCPPQAVGCTAPLTLPDGTVGLAGCLCPDWLVYDVTLNACIHCLPVGSFCDGKKECCTGKCEEGTCQCKHAG